MLKPHILLIFHLLQILFCSIVQPLNFLVVEILINVHIFFSSILIFQYFFMLELMTKLLIPTITNIILQCHTNILFICCTLYRFAKYTMELIYKLEFKIILKDVRHLIEN